MVAHGAQTGLIPLVTIIACLVLALGHSSLRAQDGPMTALERLQAGQAAYSKRDYAAALEQFEQFLADFGDSEEAAAAVASVKPLVAICLIRTRAFDAARASISEALTIAEIDRSIKLELLFWKGVCELQASAHAEAQVTFGTYFKEAPPHDPRRWEAAVLFGTGYTLQEQYPEAIAFFDARVNEADSQGMHEVSARLMTLQLHALLQTEQFDDALALTLRASERFEQFVQIIGLQSLILELGSRLLDAERHYEAIRCLHYVWPHERLLSLQQSRTEKLQKRIRTLKARGQADALVFQLDGILTRITREVEHFSKVEDYDAAVRMRLARAYLGLQRYREAGLIMESMLGEMETTPIVESASVTLIQCWLQESHWERAVSAADLYLQRFGDEAPSAATVLFMKGQAWQSARRYEEALAVFETCLSQYAKSPMTPNAAFMRGICHLQLEHYPEAIAIFREVPIAYPKANSLAESARYWEGMAHSFASDHQQCLEIMRAYLKAYPEGYYHADAAFRVGFSLHALADYDNAIATLRTFVRDNASSAYVDEARLLLGDGHLALGELEPGMAAYAQISTESVKFYEEGAFKTGKALRMSERFDEMRKHFEGFIDNQTDSARLPKALHWLAWLQQREGNLDGARESYWEAIDAHGDDSSKPTVLDLIIGLEKLYTGDDRENLASAWADRRAKALKDEQATLAVRALWAHARVLQRTQPIQATVMMTEMVPELNPEQHSARLLVDAAVALERMDAPARASDVFRDLVKWHPLALERDRAEIGLAREAMRKEDYTAALGHFEYVESRGSGTVRLGEILLDKAHCQEALGDREAALSTLEALLAEKAISAEAKAKALMQCGRWLAEADDEKKALVYFERVYLVYGRDTALVATAYWSRGQLLEQLGEREKARELYHEMVSREELREHPEYALAQQRLQS